MPVASGPARTAVERGARGALGHDAGGKVQLDQIELRAHRRRAGHRPRSGWCRHRNGPRRRPARHHGPAPAGARKAWERPRIGLDQFEGSSMVRKASRHHGHAALAALGGDGPGGDRALALFGPVGVPGIDRERPGQPGQRGQRAGLRVPQVGNRQFHRRQPLAKPRQPGLERGGIGREQAVSRHGLQSAPPRPDTRPPAGG
jgi:hypothetical protein